MGSKEKIYRERGLCGGCGITPSIKYYCQECTDKRKRKKDLTKETTLEKLRDLYASRKDSSLCVKCGKEKETDDSSCNLCLSKKRAEQHNKKLKCIAHYGNNQCNCCGEVRLKFLTIDHINGGGNVHRRELGGNSGKKPFANSKLYAWLIREEFPAGFQVLCFNCNRGKWMNNGVCPHNDSDVLCLSSFNLLSSLKDQLANFQN